MFYLKSRLIRLSAAGALVCLQGLAQASSLAASQTASAATPASPADTSSAEDLLAARPVIGDDPRAVRDTLATGRIHTSAPSLTERLRDLIPTRKPPRDLDLAKVGLDRELAFVVPLSYGVLYSSNSHSLRIDADLADDDTPGVIVLKKTVTGPSGRGMVVAAEAKAKGYIQQIDQVELKPGAFSKPRLRAHLNLAPADFAKVDGDFAIVLMCDLTPPYLNDTHDHTDPSDDNPTDVTTRTSVLYADVRAVWLISPHSGKVLSKKLHLEK